MSKSNFIHFSGFADSFISPALQELTIIFPDPLCIVHFDTCFYHLIDKRDEFFYNEQ